MKKVDGRSIFRAKGGEAARQLGNKRKRSEC